MQHGIWAAYRTSMVIISSGFFGFNVETKEIFKDRLSLKKHQ